MKLEGKVMKTQLETRPANGKSLETAEISCEITPDKDNPTAGVSGAIRFNVVPGEGASWPLGTAVTVTVEKAVAEKEGGDEHEA